jgi:polysaccharide export outer membrane protein
MIVALRSRPAGAARLRALLPALLTLLPAFLCQAAGDPTSAAGETALVDVQVRAGGSTDVVAFIGSGDMQFALHQQTAPPRLVVDFPAVRARVRNQALPADLRLVSGLQIREFGGGRQRLTRAELSLLQPVQVEVIRSPGVVTLVLSRLAADPRGPGVAPVRSESAADAVLLPVAGVAEALPAEALPADAPAAAAATADTGALDVPLGPQDLLQVKVFGVDSLDRKVRVGADGSITLPLVGSLPAAGLTRAALEREIAARLADGYVKDPQVSVFVEEYRSRRVSVAGAVRQPDVFEILRPTTLLEALALAGGVLAGEAAPRIQIQRQTPGGEAQTLEVDRGALDAGGLDQNLAIQPGDLIHVPFEEMLEVVVRGRVSHPDRYRAPRREPLTVLQAVMLAGGPAGGASTRRVEVVRHGRDGGTRTLVVNLNRIREGKEPDLPLESDDIVVVP